MTMQRCEKTFSTYTDNGNNITRAQWRSRDARVHSIDLHRHNNTVSTVFWLQTEERMLDSTFVRGGSPMKEVNTSELTINTYTVMLYVRTRQGSLVNCFIHGNRARHSIQYISQIETLVLKVAFAAGYAWRPTRSPLSGGLQHELLLLSSISFSLIFILP